MDKPHLQNPISAPRRGCSRFESVFDANRWKIMKYIDQRVQFEVPKSLHPPCTPDISIFCAVAGRVKKKRPLKISDFQRSSVVWWILWWSAWSRKTPTLYDEYQRVINQLVGWLTYLSRWFFNVLHRIANPVMQSYKIFSNRQYPRLLKMLGFVMPGVMGSNPISLSSQLPLLQHLISAINQYYCRN